MKVTGVVMALEAAAPLSVRTSPPDSVDVRTRFGPEVLASPAEPLDAPDVMVVWPFDVATDDAPWVDAAVDATTGCPGTEDACAEDAPGAGAAEEAWLLPAAGAEETAEEPCEEVSVDESPSEEAAGEAGTKERAGSEVPTAVGFEEGTWLVAACWEEIEGADT